MGGEKRSANRLAATAAGAGVVVASLASGLSWALGKGLGAVEVTGVVDEEADTGADGLAAGLGASFVAAAVGLAAFGATFTGALLGAFFAGAAGLAAAFLAGLSGFGGVLALTGGLAAFVAGGRFGAALAVALPAEPLLRLGGAFLAGLLLTSTSLLGGLVIPASRRPGVVILRRFGRAAL